MNVQQRARLLDVISEWAGIINETYAKARIDEIKAGLNETYFAWSGPTTHEPGKNGSAYYRIPFVRAPGFDSVGNRSRRHLFRHSPLPGARRHQPPTIIPAARQDV